VRDGAGTGGFLCLASPRVGKYVDHPFGECHAHAMASIPETRYARDGDVRLAYQVVGDGGPDLMFVPTATFPIDLLWDEPAVAKRRWWARGERVSGGPGYFKALLDLFLHTDVGSVLHNIQAPTLVLHRRGDRHVVGDHPRDVAARIPHARLVELDGDDHAWFAGDADRVLDEIESFLTGSRRAARTNRVLSTVLFTDIVGSTERAAVLGDQAWSTVLDAHDRIVDRHVTGARGVVVKFTGDGALATFDGPARAIDCACAIRDAVESLGLSIRAGLHTGEVEMVDGGIAVHIAARIMTLAGPGEVLVSGGMPPLVLGSRIVFDSRGSHDLKGVPHRWPVYAVRDFAVH
jgi:class 3 adenylate cyclase